MSMSLSCSSVWITLSGLKSQYTSPRSCRYPSAGSTSTAYAIACASGARGGQGMGIAGFEQPLEPPPAAAEVVVPGQVDPAEPAEGEAAEHLVLARHQVARFQLRAEREPGAAVAAETLGQPRPAVLAAPDRLLAASAEAAALRDLRIGEDGAGGVAVRHRRDLHQPRAQPASRRPPAGAPRSPGPPGTGGPAAASRARSRSRSRSRRSSGR